MLQKWDFLLFLIKTRMMFTVLESCPLFFKMDAAEIKILFGSVHYQVKKYSKDELIAQSGEEIINQLIVIEGSVKGEMMDFTGKTIKIEDIPSPRPLAPAFLFGKNNLYPVNITANEEVSLLLIPKSSFIRMMQMNEKVLSNFMNIISNRAQFLTNKIKFLSFQSIKGKLAHYLLQRMRQTDSDLIILDKSQAQLSELFGVTRPSLGRAIRELDQEGIIEARAKEVRIVDRGKLSAFLK
jgi:CRP-like cAMP-binding protein